MVEKILLSKGYIPSSVTPAVKGGSGYSFLERIKENLSAVKLSDLILFTKQFRSMMQAGIPIIRLLLVLENQTQNKTLKLVISAISRDIKSGLSLHDAMKKHPAIFSPLYLSMINAGEISGAIPDVLTKLIDIIEHEAKIKSDIKAALQYPIIVVVALIIAFFVLLTFVIPKFATIFAKAGIDLPMPTKVAMFLYHGLSNYW